MNSLRRTHKVSFSVWYRSHDSTENATPPTSTKSNDYISSVQIQIKQKSQFKFVPRDAQESEFLDWVDFGGAAFPLKSFT